MGRVYEMAIALSGKSDSSLQSSLFSANGALAGLEKKLLVVNAAQKKLGEYKGLKNSLSDTNLEYRRAQAETGALAKKLAEAGKPSKALRREFERSSKRSEELRAKYIAQCQSLRALKSEMDKAGVSARSLGKHEAELTAKAERAARAQAKLMKAQATLAATRDRLNWSNVKGQVMASAGVAMALRKPIKDAMELETTMAEIRKVVDFESPEAFKAMGADLQKLSLKIPMTTKALGEIYASGGQAGIARKDLLAFTESAAKMGVAFDVSADQAGEWMAKWRAAFGMSQGDVTVLADQINYLGNNTAATAAEISAVVSRIGPLGKVGNVAARQIAALGASIVGTGQSQETASTGIKNFMLALTSGASATKKQQEAFAALRIDPKKMAEEMMKDPEKVMTGVLERISRVDQSKQAALLTQLFGRESVGAIAPLLANLDNLKRNLSLVSGVGHIGSMQKEFDALADTGANAMQLVANAGKYVSAILGNSLLPALKSVTRGVVWVSVKIAEFSEKFPKMFDRLAKGIAILGGLKIGWSVLRLFVLLVKFPFQTICTGVMRLRAGLIAADGSIVTMIKSTKLAKCAMTAWTFAQSLWVKAMTAGKLLLNVGKVTAYKAASMAIAAVTKLWTGAQWLLNAALTANPIALVVVAIAALVTAFVVAYRKVEWFRDGVNSAMAAVRDIFLAGFGKVLAIIDMVSEKWNKVLGLFRKSPKIPEPQTQTVPVTASGAAIRGIQAHAAGGIFNRPHLGVVAENGETESIISHDKNGEPIWRATGAMAGFSPPGGDVNVRLNVNVCGGAGGDEIGRKVLRILEAQLPRILDKYHAQRERLAY